MKIHEISTKVSAKGTISLPESYRYLSRRQVRVILMEYEPAPKKRRIIKARGFLKDVFSTDDYFKLKRDDKDLER